MTAPPSIVEFLRARLTEDAEHIQRLAEDWWLDVDRQETADAVRHFAGDDRPERGVEAKRKLIDTVMAWEHELLHTGCEENVGPFPCSRDGAECDPVMCGVGEKQDQVLRALAAEFAGHEDYQKEPWAL